MQPLSIGEPCLVFIGRPQGKKVNGLGVVPHDIGLEPFCMYSFQPLLKDRNVNGFPVASGVSMSVTIRLSIARSLCITQESFLKHRL